jgi:hypothetical protein
MRGVWRSILDLYVLLHFHEDFFSDDIFVADTRTGAPSEVARSAERNAETPFDGHIGVDIHVCRRTGPSVSPF